MRAANTVLRTSTYAMAGSSDSRQAHFAAVDSAAPRANEPDPDGLHSNSFVHARGYATVRGQRYHEDEVRKPIEGLAAMFGPLFTADVGTWHQGMRILDAGAGSAQFFRALLAPNKFGKRSPGQAAMAS